MQATVKLQVAWIDVVSMSSHITSLTAALAFLILFVNGTRPVNDRVLEIEFMGSPALIVTHMILRVCIRR